MGIGVGSVYVDVLPSTAGFVRDMRRDLLAEADAIGRELGERIGREAGDAATRPIREGIENGVDRADSTGKAAKKGKTTGDAFGKALREEISRALSNLPDVEVGLDDGTILSEIGAVRAELKELAKDLTLNLDVNSDEAFARLAAIKAEIEAIRADDDTTIRVKYDLDQAAANIGELEKKIARDVGGAFENSVRDRLKAAVEAMPKINLDVTTQGAERELAIIAGQLRAMSDLADIDPHIDGEAVLAQAEQLSAELRAIISDETVDVRIQSNAQSVLTQLEAISNLRPKVEVEIDTRNLGAWRTQLQAAVESASKALPDIEIGVDATLDQRKLVKLKAQLEALATKINLGLGDEEALAKLRRIEAEFRTLAGHHIDIELDANVDTALAQLRAAITKAGTEDGDLFSSSFKHSLQAAMANLPDIRPKVDKTEADLAIEQIRKQLSSLVDKRIGIDISAADAIAKAEALQSLLTSIAETTIDPRIRMDTAAAAAELAAFLAKARGEEIEIPIVVRNLGAYAQRIRTELEAALRDLPEIEVTANTTQARAQLQNLRTEFEAFRDLEIGVDLTDQEALAGLERLKQELEALAANATEVDVKVNAQAVLARLAVIEAAIRGLPDPELNVRLAEPNLGAFFTKIQSAVRAASAAIPDIEIGADTAPVYVKLAALKTAADTIVANIRFDSDPAKVLADIEAVHLAAARLAAESPTIRIDGDVAPFLASLVEARAALLGLQASADGAAGSMSRWKLILAAVLAIFPLIAAAVLALPAAFALVATPIAAIALGMDGIKAAIAPLISQFNALKTAVSTVFEGSLVPAVQNLVQLFPTLTSGLTGTAIALSAVATQVSAVATSGSSLNTIASSFDLINGAVASSGPAIALFTQNIINLTNIGLQGLQGFAGEMQQVGQAWADVIARLSASGTAQAAVQALFQVLGELIGLIAPLTELGAVMAASLGPALAAALSIAGAAISVIAQGLDLLSQSFGSVGPSITTFVTALVALNLVLGVFGKNLAGGFIAGLRGIGPAVSAASGALGGLRAVGSGLFAAMGGVWGVAIAAVVVGLSLLGQSNANAAAQESAHRSAIQSLTQALEASGGAIDANIVKQESSNLLGETSIDTFKSLGLSVTDVASAVANGGAAYDQLIAHLQQVIDQGNAAEASANGISDAQFAELKSAEALLPVLVSQRDAFTSATAANDDYNRALSASGNSLDAAIRAQAAGVLQTTAWATALATQSKATEDVTTKINAWALAMQTASDAPRSIAAATQLANDAMRQLGDAALKGSGQFVQLNGTINTTTKAGSDLQTAVLGAAKGFDQLFAATLEQTGSYEQAAVAAGNYKVQLEQQLVTLGATPAAAKAVATSLLAIPTDLSTKYDTPGFLEGLARAQGLKVSVNDIPGNKTVLLDAIDDHARKVLEALGLTVHNLPNGQFLIDADPAPALAGMAVVRDAGGKTIIVPVTANITEAAAAVDEMTSAHMNDPIELQVNAVNNTQPAIDAAHSAAAAPASMPVNATDNTAGPTAAAHAAAAAPASMPINATDNTAGATGAAHSAASAPASMPINATDNTAGGVAAAHAAAAVPAQMPITGVDQTQGAVAAAHAAAAVPANMPINAIDNTAGGVAAAHAAASVPATMPINADPAGANGVLATLVGAVTGTTALMHINAESGGAGGILSTFVALVTGTTAMMKINADPGLANTALADLVTRVTGTTASIKVNADVAAAETAIANLARTRTTTLTVNVVTNGTVPAVPNARGNILPAGYTLFGEGATMPAGVAAMVPPNTFRVIGDRSDVDEAYIPIDRSARSKALLNITAARMGFALVQMASGGLLKQKRATDLEGHQDTPGGQANIAASLGLAGASLDNAGSGGIGQVVAQLRTLLSDSSALSTQQSGTFLSQPSPAQDRADASAVLAKANARVEERLDKIATLLAKSRQVNAPITVQDRSGNPVETARAMQLAMRLR